MKMNKIISLLLAVLMLVSGLVVTVGAEEGTEETTTPIYTYNTKNTAATIDYLKGTTLPETTADGTEISTTPSGIHHIFGMRARIST